MNTFKNKISNHLKKQCCLIIINKGKFFLLNGGIIMIKIDVISGFLGAGKTTLIKKLFTSKIKDEKVVIIENEFGEIGIDGSFLKGSGIKIKEINAGCICCSLVGDFESSIDELVTTYHPDRIIIEPSGVGKLSDILAAIKKVNLPDLKLNIVATVVDGKKAKIYLKNFGEFFINQIESCDSIIVSKLDKVANKDVDDVVNMIKEHNNHANIITTDINALDPNKLLEVLEEKASVSDKWLEQVIEEAMDDDDDCCCHHHDEDEHDEEHHCCHHHDEDEHDEEHHCCHHHNEDEHHEEHHCCHHHSEDEHDEEHHCCHHEGHHHHHHGHDADEVFQSIGIETSKAYNKESLTKFLETLKNAEDLGIIVRSKGVLKAEDNKNWYYYDFVSGDYEIREGEPDVVGKLVVIGSKLNEDKINELIKSL